ncbi:MAG: type I polyketide synthase [Alphaproteobacteria bacterium]|nr:type I polyketide synthase [Alphaproteobacteria bacterium]
MLNLDSSLVEEETQKADRFSSSIAIIGYGCRLPLGANSPSSYWKHLIEGKDCIQPIPDYRWESDPEDYEKSAKRVAGLIDHIDQFDADFFGIFPREANSMDPQQRILLETCWEALEHAGIQHEKLLGSNTGVFIGSVALDYRDRFTQMAKKNIDTYALTGNLLSIIAGRVSYVLGLEGPCSTIETACSSSLVAVHQACQNLRLRECDLVLAGGVNVLLSPVGMEFLDKAKTLSPDGKCKAFDAGANGLVRGEGCGVVILKRLDDALRDNDSIVAVIRGTAINHDGKAASLSSPNVLAQEKLLRKALQDGGLSAEDVGFVETHGTGTVLGDPIEVQALKTVYGKHREDRSKCYLGSVKSNIGHLEGAAGIAGLLKAVLALQNEAIPPQIHFNELNPGIDLENTSIAISKELVPWKRCPGKKRIAGVSSFGISGTNAHVLIEEAPENGSITSGNDAKEPCLITLSAKTDTGLRDLAQKYLDELQNYNTSHRELCDIRDISYTTQLRRSHYKSRISITASGYSQLKNALQAYIQDTPFSGLSTGIKANKRAKLAFIFPGLGSQWSGMGIDLYNHEEVFREKILSCEEVVRQTAGWSLIERLNYAGDSSASYTDLASVQLNLFSLSIAVAELWKSWGIEPKAVAGHSVGEITAAHVAGILDLDTAIRLVFARAQLLETLQNKGSMAVVEAPWEQAVELTSEYEGMISIAGSNSARLTLLSGDTQKLKELWDKCHKQRIFFRLIKDSVPSHSALVDSFLPHLEKEFLSLTPSLSKTSFYSAWQARLAAPQECDVQYWINNLRQPVLFNDTFSKMLDDGYTNFIEISPHPTLLPAMNEIAQRKQVAIKTSSSLKEGVLGRRAMFESLGELYVSGVEAKWSRLHHSKKPKYITLPSYPWQRERFWIEEKPVYFKASLEEAHDSNIQTTDQDEDIFLRVEWKKGVNLLLREIIAQKDASWLLLGDSNPAVKKIRGILEAKGYKVIQVSPKELIAEEGLDDIISLDMRDGSSFNKLLETYFANGTTCAGILHMLSFSEPLMAGYGLAQQDMNLYGCTSLMYLLQAINQQSWLEIPKLFIVTHEARPVTSTPNLDSVYQSSLWGMAESIRYEFPNRSCKCIDLSSASLFEVSEYLVNELLSGDDEEQVAYRSNKRYVARLRKGLQKDHDDPLLRTNISDFRNGTYLISGGLGALGLGLAEWLVEQGAGGVILLSRSGPKTNEQRDILKRLSEKDTIIKTPQVNVAHYEALLSVLDNLEGSMPPIRGIIHAAGIIDDGFLMQQTQERFKNVFEPKADGALNLHKFSKNLDLDFFVLYSSAAALVGSPGQSSYSAANACLDAIAHHRKSIGLPALSINWGAYKDIGIATKDRIRAERLERRGVAGIDFQMSLKALKTAIQSRQTNVGFMPFDVRQWIEFYPQAASSSYLEDLVDKTSHKASENKDLIGLIEHLPRGKKLTAVTHYVQKIISVILQQDPHKLGFDTPFSSFGLDSLTGLELRNRLEVSIGKQLPATLVWTYTNIESLAKYILSLIEPTAVDNTPINGDPSEKKSEDDYMHYLEQELGT